MTTWQKWMVVGIATICAWMVIITGILLVNAQAVEASDTGHTLTVDGVTYTPSKIVGNGPTVHYYTPGTTPSVAYTGRHVWSGNGSDNLPCGGRLHWIDNANVLTISHCESTDGTTTTTTTYADTTSTSSPQVTTTVPAPTTTTTYAITTTTHASTTTTIPRTTSTTKGESTTTTTVSASTTTLCQQDDPTLPCGGIQTGGGACAVAIEEGSPCVPRGIDWWLLGLGVFTGFGVGGLAGVFSQTRT